MVLDPGSILVAEVVKKLTTLVLDTAWKQSGQAIDKQLQKQIGDAVNQYVQTYEKRHCSLKYDCLRMDNSLKLDDIYTDVQVLNTRESRRFETPEALRELFLETGRGFVFEKTTRQEGIAVANLEPRLMVLGSPGIGKSTFLRKVGLEALKWETARYRHELIPVFIELKLFGDEHQEIETLIAEEFKTCGFPYAEESTQRLLESGKLLILLDGLDEVPTAYVDRAIVQIGRLVDRYDKNRFIASCRVAAYKGGFPRFKDVTMADFSDSQMETFVRQWFRREPKIADQYWELLNSSDYKAVKELGQTPLLLTLLCAVYDESQSLPKQRAALYGEALEVWLKKWAAERRVHRDPIYQELNLQLEQVLLSEIAYQSFAQDQLFFSKRELTEQIRAFLMNNLNAPKHLDAEAALYAIQVQQGILVERARDAYSFSHLTFQEYLTAQYIVDEQQIDMLVANHLTDQRWREVFLLVAGLMRNADRLLELMACEIRNIVICTKKLAPVVDWANEQFSVEVIKPNTKKALALFCIYALNFVFTNHLDRVRDFYSDFALLFNRGRIRSHAFSLLRALDVNLFAQDPHLGSVVGSDIGAAIHQVQNIALFLLRGGISDSIDFPVLLDQLESLKTQIPGRDDSIESERAFVACIRQTWYDALHINPEWTELSEQEIQSFQNYLHANELMIRCKEAALRVSPQVWNAIESRMLTVQDE